METVIDNTKTEVTPIVEPKKEFYYDMEVHATNIYDVNKMNVVGHIKVFSDEEKINKLTEIPLSEMQVYLTVEEIPKTSKEAFMEYIKVKIRAKIQELNLEQKFREIKQLRELGIII